MTTARFMVKGQTYAMSGITSVKATRTDPSRLGPIFLGSLGLLIVIAMKDLAGAFWGTLCFGLAVYIWRTDKLKINIILATASGESTALSSTDSRHMLAVVDAINTAIVQRG